ncbi:ATP-dependent DNA/RNA helicase PSH2, putative [Plasmodium yoelii]|nr:ATP-dependent DNA/RNA helicase PSH2, putative [Plasmodium yoelii]CDU16888.1 ATP dependent RNA helicase, putative [Plasmodium yoelii]VTZ75152.1 ATP-dependent DNA/RNA helicase PSH2, putative [Plasmodium yoelii]|eukprot:XP_022813120.1 ATP-dependent DNA/RNA helicase PSH2, putative [Plasmodium yoelii]
MIRAKNGINTLIDIQNINNSSHLSIIDMNVLSKSLKGGKKISRNINLNRTICNNFLENYNYSSLIERKNGIVSKDSRFGGKEYIKRYGYGWKNDMVRNTNKIIKILSIGYYTEANNNKGNDKNKNTVFEENELNSNKYEEWKSPQINNVNDKNIFNNEDNKILNRHEHIDVNILNVDEEIINNLKFILKINKLYMYQYIIFNEIVVKNCKHLLIYNKTGTGKTLCYLLPLIQKIINDKFDCNRNVLILTQNIYLCKQLYIYILSIYPNLNVCILSDENDSFSNMKKMRSSVVVKNNIINKENFNTDMEIENSGIHFYLCTPNKFESYIKSYKNKKKNDKNIMNNVLNCVNTIVVDEFDYIIENRRLIFNFLFYYSSKNGLNFIENEINKKENNNNYDNLNYKDFNMYLFTANINELMMKKINEHLFDFIFFDFVNGIKETIKNKENENTISCNSNKNKKDNSFQLLSKENKKYSLCNLNISHFICKINTPSKYKYVPYFLNIFFFNQKGLSNKNQSMLERQKQFNDIDKEEYDSNKLISDYMNKNTSTIIEDGDKINKCIIFSNSKDEVEKLYENAFLKPHAVMIHSDLLTAQKNENINLFKLGKKKILITTDIVSRGLDIENVVFILNYSPPVSPNDYVHRSGRTGRGKEKGVCLTIYHKYEYRNLEKVIKYTKNNFQVILCPHTDEVYKFSVDTLTDTIMKMPPEKYESLHNKSKELFEKYNTRIIAQILSILLKFDKKGQNISLLSGKKNYTSVLIKDPFFELIKNKDDIINMLKVTIGSGNFSSIVGDIAKCDEGYIADICSSSVNKIINLFNNSNSHYRNKGVEINTIIELPQIVREKKNVMKKNKKTPWIKYKLQRKKIIILGRKEDKYKKKGTAEFIKDINRPI